MIDLILPFLQVKSHVEDAVAMGGKIVTGGTGHAAGPQFFQPTLIRDVPTDALICREGMICFWFCSEPEKFCFKQSVPWILSSHAP